jgi:protein gp37
LGKDIWGPTADRRFFGDKHWDEPLKWAAAARKDGTRPRVFCASMSDVFEDRRDLDDQRARLWKLIKATPELDWLLLTKRPENFEKFLPWGGCPDGLICKASQVDGVVCAADECDADEGGWRSTPWPNVRLGVTAGDQTRADRRVETLARTPAASRFVSYEPALGPVDFRRWLEIDRLAGSFVWLKSGFAPEIDQIIVGGESGPGARPFDLAWARLVVEQCKATGTACFVKQLGSSPIWNPGDGSTWWTGRTNKLGVPRFNDRKGGDINEFPEALRVREFPR